MGEGRKNEGEGGCKDLTTDVAKCLHLAITHSLWCVSVPVCFVH